MTANGTCASLQVRRVHVVVTRRIQPIVARFRSGVHRSPRKGHTPGRFALRSSLSASATERTTIPAAGASEVEASAASRLGIISTYLFYFAIIGITQPYLPAYLKTLSFTSTDVGLLLGVSPCVALFGPILWGWVADRTGRPGQVLTLLTIGALLAMLPLLRVTQFGWLIVILTVYAVFASSMTTMLDSISLHRVSVVGGSYARLRVFGSVGYMIAAAVFGLWVERIDVAVIVVCLVLWGGALLSSTTVRVRVKTGSRPRPWSGFELLRDPGLRALIIAACLHWIACAPYHGQFGIHAMALGFKPYVTGTAFAVGVLAEVLVMWWYPKVAERWQPWQLLCAAFLASVLRWLGMALSSDPAVIIALTVLHGLSFGVFYSASVLGVSRRVPAELRSSGQALFVAITFGFGALAGNVLAGWLHDTVGGHGMFGVAAALELVPVFVILNARRAFTSPAAVDLR